MIERSEKLAVIDNTLKDQVSCYTLNFLKDMVDRKACALLDVYKRQALASQ